MGKQVRPKRPHRRFSEIDRLTLYELEVSSSMCDAAFELDKRRNFGREYIR